MSEKAPGMKKTHTLASSLSEGILPGIFAGLMGYTIVGSTIAGPCAIYPDLRSRPVQP